MIALVIFPVIALIIDLIIFLQSVRGRDERKAGGLV